MFLTTEEIEAIVAADLTADQRGQTYSLPICANKLWLLESADLLGGVPSNKIMWVAFTTSPPFLITLDELRNKQLPQEELQEEQLQEEQLQEEKHNQFFYNLCHAATFNTTSP